MGTVVTILFWIILVLVSFVLLRFLVLSIKAFIGNLLYRWACRVCSHDFAVLYDEISVLQSMVDSQQNRLISKEGKNGQLKMNFDVPVADKTRIYQRFNNEVWSISRYDLTRWERGDTLVLRGNRPTWLSEGKDPSKGDKVAKDSTVLWRFEYELDKQKK